MSIKDDAEIRVRPYIIKKDILGKGSQGSVRVAIHESTGEKFAVKVLNKSHIHSQNMAENIRREIVALRQLNHPHIIKLQEVLASKKNIYIIMELIQGCELFTLLEEQGKLSEYLAQFILKQLIEALAYCHSQGIFHRDLKPENVMICGKFTAKIADFGLCAVTNPDRDRLDKEPDNSASLCETLVGSLHYIPPEFILKGEGKRGAYDAVKSDIYSMGIILYLMLTCRMPFHGQTTQQTKTLILEKDPYFPEYISNRAKRLLKGMMCKDPTKRLSIGEIKESEWYQKGMKPSKEDLDLIKKFYKTYNNAEELEDYSTGTSIGFVPSDDSNNNNNNNNNTVSGTRAMADSPAPNSTDSPKNKRTSTESPRLKEKKSIPSDNVESSSLQDKSDPGLNFVSKMKKKAPGPPLVSGALGENGSKPPSRPQSRLGSRGNSKVASNNKTVDNSDFESTDGPDSQNASSKQQPKSIPATTPSAFVTSPPQSMASLSVISPKQRDHVTRSVNSTMPISLTSIVPMSPTEKSKPGRMKSLRQAVFGSSAAEKDKDNADNTDSSNAVIFKKRSSTSSRRGSVKALSLFRR